jgi:hypothetical protein
MLAFALEAAGHEVAQTRELAVQLVSGILHQQADLAPAIEAHAAAMLQRLAQQPEQAQQQQQQQQQQQGEADAAAQAAAQAARATQLADLHVSLCARAPRLLRQLAEAYGAAPPRARPALHARAAAAARAIGPTDPHLLALLQQAPPGSAPLLLHLVAALVTAGDEAAVAAAAAGQALPPAAAAAAGPGALPPRALVDACLCHHQQHQQRILLALVAAGLAKAEAAQLLPQLLELEPPALRALFKRLTEAPAGAAAGVFAPAELLVALNRVDCKATGLPMKRLVAAVDTALHAPETFPQQVGCRGGGRAGSRGRWPCRRTHPPTHPPLPLPQVLATSLNQLLTLSPLPPLFMRMVIQVRCACCASPAWRACPPHPHPAPSGAAAAHHQPGMRPAAEPERQPAPRRRRRRRRCAAGPAVGARAAALCDGRAGPPDRAAVLGGQEPVAGLHPAGGQGRWVAGAAAGRGCVLCA